MGYKYSGDAILGVSLSVNTPKPLDSRSVVENLSELYNIPENTAYQGMTVANISNGNLYMLVDKSKINEKAGWKASYESIQIITCTEKEYKEWEENTNENYTPKDETKSFLHQDTYYYIYEDSLSPATEEQEYLTRKWGEQIEDSLKKKGSEEAVIALDKRVTADENNLKDNYLKKVEIIDTYATKTLLQTSLQDTLINYYTKDESDGLFVTKETANDYVTIEMLKGSNSEDDDFIFVTQNQYSKNREEDANEFTTKNLISESTTTQTQTIKNSDGESVLTSTNNVLLVNGDQIALLKEVPKIICISQSDYDKETNLDPDTYYYVYEPDNDFENGFVKGSQIEEYYYNKNTIDKKLKELIDRIELLEAYHKS